jgi:uncharacterized protein
MIESMIFFPEKTLYEKPEDYGFQYEEVTVATEDKVEIFGWYLKTKELDKQGVLLFFHGNAGNISSRLHKAKGWIERGFDVFLIDYRGYGRSQGEIRHSDDVVKDANAALDYLTEKKKKSLPDIVLYGESLGTYPAVKLGTENPVAAVILEAPFTSMFDVAKTHYPFVMKPLMQNYIFSNLDEIGKLKAPLFVLHGNNDEICPYAMAGELFEKAPEPKGFLSIPNGMHNDLPITAGDDFWQKPYEFLMKNRSRPHSR